MGKSGVAEFLVVLVAGALVCAAVWWGFAPQSPPPAPRCEPGGWEVREIQARDAPRMAGWEPFDAESTKYGYTGTVLVRRPCIMEVP